MSNHYIEKLARELDERREASLKRIREAGMRLVEVLAAENDLTCDAVWEYDSKTFDVEKAPDLPVAGCDAEYCRCMYVPVIEDD